MQARLDGSDGHALVRRQRVEVDAVQVMQDHDPALGFGKRLQGGLEAGGSQTGRSVRRHRGELGERDDLAANPQPAMAIDEVPVGDGGDPRPQRGGTGRVGGETEAVAAAATHRRLTVQG